MSRFAHSPLLLVAALFCMLAPRSHAQIDVSLDMVHRLYLSYEPIIVTVKITNLSGRDITLRDQAPDKWFSFEVLNASGDPIPPIASDYHLDPLTIPAGETVARKVNLVNLYPVTDYGSYHLRAIIFSDELQSYFGSKGTGFEVSEGQTLWSQKVGIPQGQKDAGQFRTYSLVSFRQTKNLLLYVRVEDDAAGLIYGTYALGALVNGYPPQAQVDALSQLHILEMVAPKEYFYTRIGPDASMLGQQDYTDLKTSPRLKRTAEGDVNISGGIEVLPKSPDANTAATGPKLSDRPAGMPGGGQ
jgi:hypothetical protein